MEMMKCEICGWNKGWLHNHHIIPLSEGGENVPDNYISICPNCHGEAHQNLEEFNEKNNLVGVEISLGKKRAMDKCCDPNISSAEKLNLMIAFGFMHEEAIAYRVGMTVNNLLRVYLRLNHHQMNDYYKASQRFTEYAKNLRKNLKR